MFYVRKRSVQRVNASRLGARFARKIKRVKAVYSNAVSESRWAISKLMKTLIY
jgi:hypothetical protein